MRKKIITRFTALALAMILAAGLSACGQRSASDPDNRYEAFSWLQTEPEPVAVEPENAEPETAKPGDAEPVAAEPGDAEPEATEPAAEPAADPDTEWPVRPGEGQGRAK